LRRKLGKHTLYFELIDAQGQAGCPICRLARKAAARYLDSILYEAVLDPDVRAKLKRSRGFCTIHVKMLLDRRGRALGIALIYRDIIGAVAEAIDKGHHETRGVFHARLLRKRRNSPAIADMLTADQPCPACAIGEEAEDSYVDLLLAHLRDDRFHMAYVQGEGLCLPHFLRCLERVDDEKISQRLVDPQITRYRLMIGELDEFIRKRDHRFRQEKYGEEGDVWLRAMNAITGGVGLGFSAKKEGSRLSDFESEEG